MARKKQGLSVRFFTADGVEVESILDLAGPHKDELVKRILTALARDAAKRDYLAELGLPPNDQDQRSTSPADGPEGR